MVVVNGLEMSLFSLTEVLLSEEETLPWVLEEPRPL